MRSAQKVVKNRYFLGKARRRERLLTILDSNNLAIIMKTEAYSVVQFAKESEGQIVVSPYISVQNVIRNNELVNVLIHSCLKMESNNMIYDRVANGSSYKLVHGTEIYAKGKAAENDPLKILKEYKENRTKSLELMSDGLVNVIKRVRKEAGLETVILYEKIKAAETRAMKDMEGEDLEIIFFNASNADG